MSTARDSAGVGLDGYVRRGLMEQHLIRTEADADQYCFYVNLMWGLSLEDRNALIELYWRSSTGDQSWVPTLAQFRAKCSAIFLEKIGDSSGKNIGELLLKVHQAGSETKG